MREASRTIAIMILGALLGIAGFVAIDRSTGTNYQPPKFEQNSSDQDWRSAADLPSRAPPARSHPYRNCADARAAGAAPLYAGEPGYGEHMDGDGDGVACEPYYGR